jgi:predicted PurR-regulated permease PerM
MHIVDGQVVIGWLRHRWPALVLALILVALFGVLWPLLPPFFLGAFWSYCCHPVVRWSETWGVNRVLSAFFLTLVAYALLTGLWFFLVPFVRDFSHNLTLTMPAYQQDILRALDPLVARIFKETSPKIQANIDAALGGILQGAGVALRALLGYLAQNAWGLVQMVGGVLVAPIIAFHLTKDSAKIRDWLRKRLSLTQRSYARGFAQLLNQALGAYVRGQALVCVVMALYYTVGLSFLGVQGAAALGVLTGLAIWVPYLGFACGFLLSCLGVLLQTPQSSPLLGIVLLYACGQVLEGIFLTPLLVGRRTGVHPLWVLFAIMVGGFFKGLSGVFMALPVVAILTALWRIFDQHWVLPRTAKSDLVQAP